MSVQSQMRFRMAQQRQMMRHRQQSVLNRAGIDVGLPADEIGVGQRIQGKASFNVQQAYGRSQATMS